MMDRHVTRNRLIGWALVLAAGVWFTLALLLITQLNILAALSTDQADSFPLHDSYYVIPGPAVGLVVFGIGLMISLVFRTGLVGDGVRAAIIRRWHLVSTTLLVIVWSIVQGLLRTTWLQRDSQALAMTLSVILVLMMLAHGAALTAAGVTALRTSHA